MKKKIFAGLVALVFFLNSSCDSNSGTSPNPGQQISSGTWRVTLFTDNGNDETSDFAGYNFSFNSGGVLTAVKVTVTQNGTWSFNSSSNKFTIDMGPNTVANKPLGELTDDWKVLSSSDTEIRLQDDNPAKNEFVTFTKS